MRVTARERAPKHRVCTDSDRGPGCLTEKCPAVGDSERSVPTGVVQPPGRSVEGDTRNEFERVLLNSSVS